MMGVATWFLTIITLVGTLLLLSITGQHARVYIQGNIVHLPLIKKPHVQLFENSVRTLLSELVKISESLAQLV
jgi:hypothetical protein